MHCIVTASALALVLTLSLAASVGADRHTCPAHQPASTHPHDHFCTHFGQGVQAL